MQLLMLHVLNNALTDFKAFDYGTFYITVVEKSFWTPHLFGLSLQSAIQFSAVTNIYPHVACALSCPSQNWMAQRQDVFGNTPKYKNGKEFCFLIVLCINNKQQNH